MAYCVNPACTNPKNPNNVPVCQACSAKLCLRDRYQVLGLLGKGGFGTTFVARDFLLPGNPYCVVKQLRPSSDDPGVFKMAKELFEREAHTLGQVGSHPQVPRLLDYFEENQQFYLVQEYVKGHNLYQEVKKNGPFSEAGVKQFLSELLPILQYIHQEKVIHRDLKPANLIRRETDRKLVLIDFGAVKTGVNTVLASGTSEHTALTAFAVGTMGFAPPEQMAMRPVYASDVYALGVTCVYLLTAKSPKEMGCNHETGELDWLKFVKVSEPFAKVLHKMMELTVRYRYKSAGEVLEALEMVPYAESLKNSFIALSPASASVSLDRGETSSSVSRNLQNPRSQFSTGSASVAGMKTGSLHRADPSSLMVGKRSTRSSENPLIAHKYPRLETKILLNAYRQGKRDFAQMELSRANLTKVYLPGINLYNSQLAHVNFQEAELSAADLGRVNLSQALLKNANLSAAYLGYADLEGADLRGANLGGANLKYANLRGANLCGANLMDAQVTQSQLALAKTNWMTVMPSGKRGFW